MMADIKGKIAFVYPSRYSLGLTVGETKPNISIICDSYPSEQTIAINFGVIDFNGIDNYSLEVSIFHNDEDVTIPAKKSNLFKYEPRWGDTGEFVAEMAVIDTFVATAPGYYRIKLQLLFRDSNPESVWEVIDVASAYFSVSTKWKSNDAI